MKMFVIFALVSLVVLSCNLSTAPTDPNGDGRLNVIDCLLVQRHILGIHIMTPAEYARSDINHDGTVDQKDIDKMVDIILRR